MTPDQVAHLATSVTLVDGATLHLRPIVPDDAPLLVEGFARLSPESRFLRFFSPLDHLSDAQLRYLTEIDYEDHFAWVAFVDGPDGEPVGVGVARYVRDHDDATAAEAAVVVADEHHRRGIGSILLEALASVALTHDVERFDLMVRSDNHAMISTMHELEADRAPSDDAAVIRFVLDLPPLAAALSPDL